MITGRIIKLEEIKKKFDNRMLNERSMLASLSAFKKEKNFFKTLALNAKQM